MDMDFVIDCSLVRHNPPRIRFLFISARFCAPLPSNITSR